MGSGFKSKYFPQTAPGSLIPPGCSLKTSCSTFTSRLGNPERPDCVKLCHVSGLLHPSLSRRMFCQDPERNVALAASTQCYGVIPSIWGVSVCHPQQTGLPCSGLPAKDRQFGTFPLSRPGRGELGRRSTTDGGNKLHVMG